MKLTIFSRLVMGYLAIFVLVMGMSLYAIVRIGQFNDVTRSVLMADNRIMDYKEKLKDAILSQVRYERKFIITKDEVLYAQFLRFSGEFEQYLEKAMPIADSAQTVQSLNITKQYYRRYQNLVDEEVKHLKAGYGYSPKGYQQRKEKAVDGIVGELGKLGSYSQQNVYNKIKSLNKAGAESRRVIMVMMGALLILGILNSIFINRSITQPISIMKKKTREIAKGNFEDHLALSSSPEIEELAASFNLMCTKLKDLDKIKSDFFSSMSHELRTPLTSIKEGVGLLREGVGGVLTEKQKRLLTILAMETDRLIDLVNSLLDLSKMEAGMMPYRFEQGDLVPLIDRAMMEIGPIVESKKIAAEKRFNGSLPKIKMDSERILQALRNLIGNAVKFTPEGGRVNVSVHLVNRNVEVSIADTGPGIPAENLSKIFDKFQQATLTGSYSMKGTGLGLAVVKHIISSHGGKIWAESEPGHGSTFIFILPA
jgi:two-component system sensor histidine kinase GlrK